MVAVGTVSCLILHLTHSFPGVRSMSRAYQKKLCLCPHGIKYSCQASEGVWVDGIYVIFYTFLPT